MDFPVGHVVSITVRDSAAMLDAIQGPELTSPYHAPSPARPFLAEVGRDPGRLRISFTDRSPYGDAIDPEIAAGVRDVATMLSELGHHVEEKRACPGRRSGRARPDHLARALRSASGTPTARSAAR